MYFIEKLNFYCTKIIYNSPKRYIFAYNLKINIMIYLAVLHAAILLTTRALMISREKNREAAETHKKFMSYEK